MRGLSSVGGDTDIQKKEYERKKRYLIDFLLDIEDPDVTGRDDAAMELMHFGDDEVVEVLERVGGNLDEHDVILSSCGESLGGIWIDREHFDMGAFEKLVPVAKGGVCIVVREGKQEWFKHYNLDPLSN
ncbi:MAG: hypothetical protein ACI8RA_002535 [Chlamydiales bacterium]|jgi:hypothetical protein